MGNKILRIYLAFRDPKVFLVILGLFIVTSITAHLFVHWDVDWGITNMTLSIEASVAGAVLMMVAERSAKVQDEMAKLQREQLNALIAMAEADRKLSTDTADMLRQLIENDRLFLTMLGQKWNPTNQSPLPQTGSPTTPC